MLEVIRMVADWLEDGTNGVSAMIDTVPRDGGDSAPPDVTVNDETRDDRIARGRVADGNTTGPLLTVAVVSADHLRGSVATDDGWIHTDLVIHYSRRNADPSTVKQDAAYTFRAVIWSLRRLQAAAIGSSGRERNSVRITQVEAIRYEPTYQAEKDILTVGGVLLTLEARDYATI